MFNINISRRLQSDNIEVCIVTSIIVEPFLWTTNIIWVSLVSLAQLWQRSTTSTWHLSCILLLAPGIVIVVFGLLGRTTTLHLHLACHSWRGITRVSLLHHVFMLQYSHLMQLTFYLREL